MKKKWLGIALALLVVVAAVVTVVMLNDTKTEASGEYKLTLSTEKTVFAYGEDIVIKYEGLSVENFNPGGTDDTWHDVELRLEKGHNLTARGSRHDYIDMTKMDTTLGSLTPKRDASGTVSLPADGHDYGSSMTAVPVGEYTIWAFDWGESGIPQVTNKIEIVVEIPQYPIQLELVGGGTDVMLSEGVHVNFTGMTEALFKKSNGQWMDVELRLMQGHGLTDAEMLSAKLDYADLGPLGSGSHAVANTTITESGVRVFTADGTGGDNFAGSALKEGKFTLAVFLYDTNSHYTTSRVRISNVVEINIYQTLISTNKTQYAFGEDIIVNHKGIPSTLWTASSGSTNSELLIYDMTSWFSLTGNKCPWGYPEGTSYKGSTAGIELGAQGGYTEGSYPMPAGSFTFPTDKSWQHQNPLLPGKYRVVIAYQPGYMTRASNIVEIEVLAPELSIDKTDIGYGEDITVSYKNVGPQLAGSSYIEIGLFSVGMEVGNDTNLKYYVVKNSTTDRCTSGSFSLKTGMESGGPNGLAADYVLDPGEYFLALRTSYYMYDNDGDPSRKECNTCTVGTSVVYFTVHAPEVTLDKTEYEFGEAITMDYEWLTEAWLKSGSVNWVSIDIFNRNTVPSGNLNEENGWTATGGALMESVIYNHTGTSYGEAVSKLAAASLSFPDADNDNKADRFPLAPGKYHVVVRSTNTVVSEGVIEFTVKEPKIERAVELNNSISMHYFVTCGDALSVDPMIKFTLGSTTFDAVAAYEKVEENGLVTYKFKFDNILPQQMTDNLKAELVFNGSTRVTWDNYSIKQNAMNLLANEDYKDSWAIVVALLNYGAEAQKYFIHNTDDLANSDLTTDQAGYLTSQNFSGASYVEDKLSGSDLGTYAWKAVTLDLQSSLSFRLRFTADNIDNVTITDGANNTYTITSHPDQFFQSGDDWYFYYEDIYASEFGEQFDITMSVNGLDGTQTVHYSVNSFIKYIADKSENETSLKSICQALYDYGVQAAAYGN